MRPPMNRPSDGLNEPGLRPSEERTLQRVASTSIASSSIQIELAGTRVCALATRALAWPEGGLLVIADPHFGKAASFRAHGVPVPGGTTGETLANLDAALAASGAARLVIVGDFLHHRSGASARVFAALADWRARHRALAIDLVLGNHDLHAGRPPPELGIDVHEQALDLGPFRFAHAPCSAPGRHVVAGHLHPAHVLSTGNESVRLPCFVAGTERTVLPAFGAFTGSAVMRLEPQDRVYVLAGEGIFAVPR